MAVIAAPRGTIVVPQDVAAASWTIVHDLDAYPAVTAVDSGGNEVVGQLTYLDRDQLRLDFGSAFAGAAYLNV